MPKPHFLKWKDAPEEMRQAHLLKVYSNGRGWTTDPPTEPGWYWVYFGIPGGRIVQYFKTLDGDVRSGNKDTDKHVKYWLGPLPVPEPPQ
jgi:hypothetical protein